MKTACVLLAAVSLASFGDVSETRALYGSVKTMIEEGTLYRTRVEINPDGLMYPAVGIYGENLTFFWDLDPESYPESRLLFVSVDSRWSAVEEYREFLFDGDDLVFCFRSGGYDMTEERFYFQNGELYRYILNDDATDDPGEGERAQGETVLLESGRLLEAFGLIHH